MANNLVRHFRIADPLQVHKVGVAEPIRQQSASAAAKRQSNVESELYPDLCDKATCDELNKSVPRSLKFRPAVWGE
ncbi:MAG: hypothetical protein RXR52_12370 [Paraburkholderia sp.]|uniref:hypothetical protein n=1 Tax=Paraburkholderia sp. TaxID=1926495 RepID=UPI0039782D7A